MRTSHSLRKNAFPLASHRATSSCTHYNVTFRNRDASLNDNMVASINAGWNNEESCSPFLLDMCNPDGTQVKRRKRKLFQGVIVEASDTREVSNGLKGMTFVWSKF
jgi:hypothetical protein